MHYADVNGDGVDGMRITSIIPINLCLDFYMNDGIKVYVATTEYTVHGITYFTLSDSPSRIINGTLRYSSF